MHVQTPVLSVKELTYKRGPLTILSNLHFDGYPNQCIAITGNNGSGKSTTLHILAGLLPPQSGRIVLNNETLYQNPMVKKETLGFLPETTPLYHDLTPQEYLEYVGNIRRLPLRSLPQRIEEICESLHIEPYRHQLIEQLSKGQKQRVGIAQAILHNPSLLLLDEPTQGLDQTEITRVMDFLLAYRKNTLIILTTHYLKELQNLCTHVLKIPEGVMQKYDYNACQA